MERRTTFFLSFFFSHLFRELKTRRLSRKINKFLRKIKTAYIIQDEKLTRPRGNTTKIMQKKKEKKTKNRPLSVKEPPEENQTKRATSIVSRATSQQPPQGFISRGRWGDDSAPDRPLPS